MIDVRVISQIPPGGRCGLYTGYGQYWLHYLERADSGQTDGGLGNSVLIATEPLDENAAWTAFQPGELRLYRGGIMILSLMTQPVPAPETA
ncbi:class II glutamine amidotransferase [Sideroxydans sp.]|jgi:predicted glutamine amidotransferase